VKARLAALLLTLLLAHAPPAPQQYGVWVLLDTAAANSALPPAVSDDVLARRAPLDIDRPVNPALVARIADAGARVRHASRWLRAVAVDADARTLRRIARIDGVIGFAPIRHGYAADGGSTRAALVHGTKAVRADSAFYGPLYPALRELNIPVLHDMDYTGAGVRIAILDTGFNLTHEALAGLDVAAARDFINGDDVVSHQPGDPFLPDPEEHGTRVWSLVGGHAPNRLVAGAFDAAFYLAKVDDPVADSRADEDRWVAAVEWADSIGVHIINSSIGFRDEFTDQPPIPYGQLDGNTTITTRAADAAARSGILVVVAIGNDGPVDGTLWAPADADSVMSVGAVDSVTVNRQPVPSDASSRGPTADGRPKPEVAARGANLTAASSQGTSNYDVGLNGTSYATPFITSAAAIFMQAWPALSPMAVRRAMMLAGTNAAAPNVAVGSGVPDVAAAVMMPEGIEATSVGSTDLEGNLTTIGPTFLWTAPLVHARFRPITYRVEVATDALFTNIVYSDTTRDAFLHTARQALRPMTGFWRVVATSPQGVRRVTAAQPIVVPTWVRLLALNEPQTMFINESRPTLEWRPLAAPEPLGPFIYDVEVLNTSGAVVQRVADLSGTSSVRVPAVLQANQSYRWRVVARTQQGGRADTVTSQAPFVIVSDEAPPSTLLYNPFPNPLRRLGTRPGDGLSIWFDLAEVSDVELTVHDSRGRLVRSLIPGHRGCGSVRLPAGLYGRAGQQFSDSGDGCVIIHWDGLTGSGEPAVRGVYVLRLRAGNTSVTQRFLVLPID